MRTFRAPGARTGESVEIRRRLFCFPYAGAGASIFRLWSELLPADVELCAPVLPGREVRVNEPAIADMPALITSLLERIGPRLTLPYALFGHSLGAFVAFDLAQEIAARGLAQPVRLFVSAQRGPSLPYPGTPIFHLPDGEFLKGVTERYQRFPPALLREEAFMRVLLPMLRADFTLVEDYKYRATAKLSCPITVFGGTEDKLTKEQLEAWSKETIAPTTVHFLPGGHFFMDSARKELVAFILNDL
jgi:surfactin synthase thioesterase subunit